MSGAAQAAEVTTKRQRAKAKRVRRRRREKSKAWAEEPHRPDHRAREQPPFDTVSGKAESKAEKLRQVQQNTTNNEGVGVRLPDANRREKARRPRRSAQKSALLTAIDLRTGDGSHRKRSGRRCRTESVLRHPSYHSKGIDRLTC